MEDKYKMPEPVSMEEASKGLERHSIYKYRLVKVGRLYLGEPIYRIQALKYFDGVVKGELGGFVYGYHNLSQEGNCWIYYGAMAIGNSRIKGDAKVRNKAVVGENAEISGQAEVIEHSKVRGNAKVKDFGVVNGYSIVEDNATVKDFGVVNGCAKVEGNATVKNFSKVSDYSVVGGHIITKDKVDVQGHALLDGTATISSQADYLVFKNTWSSGRYFTYIIPIKKWCVGCFCGTGEELVKKAYEDSELKGKMYSLYVNLVKDMESMENGG